VVSIGSATAAGGAVRRGQDGWLGEVLDADAPSTPGTEPIRAKEAWSQSFRLDPPAPLVSGATPGGLVVKSALQGTGLVDPRALTLAALVALGIALALRTSDPAIALGAVLAGPALAISVAFASPAVLALGAILAAGALVRGERRILAGAMLGATAVVTASALFATPLPLAPRPERPRRSALVRGLAGLALGGGVMLAAALALVPVSMVLGGRGSGLGLGALLAYRGWEGARLAGVAAWLLPAIVVASAALRWKTTPSLHVVGLATLAGLWVMPSASPHALAVPLALLVLGAVQHKEEPPVGPGTLAWP
jgi:hypothetical protein